MIQYSSKIITLGFYSAPQEFSTSGGNFNLLQPNFEASVEIGSSSNLNRSRQNQENLDVTTVMMCPSGVHLREYSVGTMMSTVTLQ